MPTIRVNYGKSSKTLIRVESGGWTAFSWHSRGSESSLRPSGSSAWPGTHLLLLGAGDSRRGHAVFTWKCRWHLTTSRILFSILTYWNAPISAVTTGSINGFPETLWSWAHNGGSVRLRFLCDLATREISTAKRGVLLSGCWPWVSLNASWFYILTVALSHYFNF